MSGRIQTGAETGAGYGPASLDNLTSVRRATVARVLALATADGAARARAARIEAQALRAAFVGASISLAFARFEE